MNILTKAEGENWLREHQLPTNQENLTQFYRNKISYLIDKDSGVKTALSRSLLGFIKESLGDNEGVFWITEWGIWPSSENQTLFYAYRKTLGEERTIINVPFHVFNKNDLDSMECLVDLALYFIWGFMLIIREGKTIIRVSHDESIEVYSQEDAELTKYKNLFEGFEFPKFTGFKKVR